MSLAWPPKDPVEVADFEVDWTDKLAGDTIETSSFSLQTAAGLTIESEDKTANSATVWLSGGTAGQTATIVNTITTAGGRTLEEVVNLAIVAADPALVVETGAGVAGADSYAALAYIDAYWTARPHDPLAATWASTSLLRKAGAAREATSYIDATWGPYFRGRRRGYIQGRLFPRTGAIDDAGFDLPDLPPELPAAVAELAPRALASRLAQDIDQGARVRSLAESVGPISTRTEYFDGGANALRTSYGVVADLLAPLLNGSQPNAPNALWTWR
jgi:hypothetical protein